MTKLNPPPGYEVIPISDGTIVARLNCNVLQADRCLIKSVSPQHQLINWALSHFIYAIATELRTRGIVTFTPESRDQLIGIVERRCAPVGATRATGTVSSDDTGEVEGVRESLTGDESEFSGVEKRNPRRHGTAAVGSAPKPAAKKGRGKVAD